MGCEPKRRYAKARQGKRRSHLSTASLATETCPQCHSAKQSHHVCPTCGSYGGKQVIEVKRPKKS